MAARCNTIQWVIWQVSSHNISYGHYVRLIHFQLFQFIMQIRLSRAGFNWILRKPSLLKYMFFLLPTVVWMTKKVWTADKSLLLHRTFTARTQNTRFAQVQIFITCIFLALSANKWPCQHFTIFRVIKWLVTNEECSAAACSLQHDGPVIVQLQCPASDHFVVCSSVKCRGAAWDA